MEIKLANPGKTPPRKSGMAEQIAMNKNPAGTKDARNMRPFHPEKPPALRVKSGPGAQPSTPKTKGK
jgi:hypothetical protein